MTKRYTLGNGLENSAGMYWMMDDGEELWATATPSVINNIGDKCEIIDGDFYDGIYIGGHFFGGHFFGGTFLGGEFDDGYYYDGKFYGGEFENGEYYAGESYANNDIEHCDDTTERYESEVGK